MKHVAFTISIAFLLLSTSCATAKQNKIPSEVQTDGRQILFFTNQEVMDNEAVYYDALLDLRKQFPEEFKNMIVYQEGHSVVKKFDINTFPAIVVIDDHNVVFHIEGSVAKKEDIVQPMEKLLSK